MSDKKVKLYYKVYADRNSMNRNFYVEKPENLEIVANESYESDNCEYPVVFEPIWLTEKDFNNLEEFEGF